MRCKLFSSGGVSLSDVLPTFEHMGAKVVDERPYEITPATAPSRWIYDFGLRCAAEDVERVRDIFQDAFLGVWRGELEDDGSTGWCWRRADRARDHGHPRDRQVPAPGRDRVLGRVHGAHAARPSGHRDDARQAVRRAVRSRPARRRRGRAAEDRDRAGDRRGREPRRGPDPAQLPVGRAAMLRTNFFGVDERRPPGRTCRSSSTPAVPLLPLPRPRFEIFVYSPRVEGVHLRGGKVARGGLRWSDRREDFRTEILGLMKAQMVKNALIVPVGSKGGFVVKRPPARAAGRRCWRRGSPATGRSCRACSTSPTTSSAARSCAPERVVRYDEDDPYLVVAADKGTATFSDIANEVSAGVRLLARRRVRVRRLARLRPQADGDHRARRVGVGQAPLPRARHRHPGRPTSPSSGSATCPATCSATACCSRATSGWSPRSTTCTCSSIPIPIRRRSFAERQRLFELPRSSWSDYDRVADLRGRWRVPAQREVDPDLAAGPGGARDRGERARPTS